MPIQHIGRQAPPPQRRGVSSSLSRLAQGASPTPAQPQPLLGTRPGTRKCASFSAMPRKGYFPTGKASSGVPANASTPAAVQDCGLPATAGMDSGTPGERGMCTSPMVSMVALTASWPFGGRAARGTEPKYPAVHSCSRSRWTSRTKTWPPGLRSAAAVAMEAILPGLAALYPCGARTMAMSKVQGSEPSWPSVQRRHSFSACAAPTCRSLNPSLVASTTPPSTIVCLPMLDGSPSLLCVVCQGTRATAQHTLASSHADMKSCEALALVSPHHCSASTATTSPPGLASAHSMRSSCTPKLMTAAPRARFRSLADALSSRSFLGLVSAVASSWDERPPRSSRVTRRARITESISANQRASEG
mmetsp:Transcript_16315/g.61889  ORF Transcript_16315/g.61889 Transcript_16315/m.61889 type:complete len:361 (+) Transcript_16315:92-1174(+)